MAPEEGGQCGHQALIAQKQMSQPSSFFFFFFTTLPTMQPETLSGITEGSLSNCLQLPLEPLKDLCYFFHICSRTRQHL